MARKGYQFRPRKGILAVHDPQPKINDPVMVKVKVNEVIAFVHHLMRLGVHDLSFCRLREASSPTPAALAASA